MSTFAASLAVFGQFSHSYGVLSDLELKSQTDSFNASSFKNAVKKIYEDDQAKKNKEPHKCGFDSLKKTPDIAQLEEGMTDYSCEYSLLNIINSSDNSLSSVNGSLCNEDSSSIIPPLNIKMLSETAAGLISSMQDHIFKNSSTEVTVPLLLNVVDLLKASNSFADIHCTNSNCSLLNTAPSQSVQHQLILCLVAQNLLYKITLCSRQQRFNYEKEKKKALTKQKNLKENKKNQMIEFSAAFDFGL